jgi:RimJ/RimL family protein N-acetyltransferase
MSDMSGLPLCSGKWVSLRPVLVEDIHAIVRLRNAARQWFLDSRAVDAEGVAAWLAGQHFPEEALLRIETQDGRFLGVAGWSHLCLASGEAEIGRLMIDRKAVVRELPDSGRNVAVDAVRAIGRYLFIEYGLKCIKTSFLAGNHTAAIVNQRCGMHPVGIVNQMQSDKLVDVHHLELSKSRWLFLQDFYAEDG